MKFEKVFDGVFVATSELFYVYFRRSDDCMGEGWTLTIRGKKCDQEQVIAWFYSNEVPPGFSVDGIMWKGEAAINRAEEIAIKLGYL